MLDRVAGRGAPVGNAELAKDFSKMGMHRPTAEKKFARDLSISPSAGQQAQHLGLAWRQVMNADRIDMPQPDGWHAAVQLCSPLPQLSSHRGTYKYFVDRSVPPSVTPLHRQDCLIHAPKRR